MSLYRPAQLNNFVPKTPDPVQFSTVTALPTLEVVPGGGLYTFRFGNGYGAHIIESSTTADHSFEFCVLDCTGAAPVPDFSTSVSNGVQIGLTLMEAQKLLKLTSELPMHSSMLQAEQWLSRIEF